MSLSGYRVQLRRTNDYKWEEKRFGSWQQLSRNDSIQPGRMRPHKCDGNISAGRRLRVIDRDRAVEEIIVKRLKNRTWTNKESKPCFHLKKTRHKHDNKGYI